MLERLKTDILILGSGGAGLFAALHAHQANPDLDITVATKGLLGKCGCTRMVQGGYNVALNPGDSIERHFMDTIEGGKWLPNQEMAWTLVTKAVERVHELENEIGCFFDRNADGTLHGKAFAGPDLRPHRAQGRPDRHRDHQPADGAGVGAADPAAGGASRRGADSSEGRAVACRRAADRYPYRPVSLRRGARPCCWPRAAGRPCTATTRPPATRAWTGLPWRCAWGCRCATWRWCSSTPPACWPAPTRA